MDDDPFKLAEKSIIKTKDFFRSMGIPSSLSEAGINPDDAMIEQMADEILMFGKIGNLQILNKNDVIAILKSVR